MMAGPRLLVAVEPV
ncbi:hypothetical protein LINPERPRIM_LOCUS39469 [Linum perenne]